MLPAIPHPATLWRSLCSWLWVLFLVLFLAAMPDLIVDFWFFDSLGRSEIFWTNLSMQLLLFVVGMLAVGLFTIVPLRRYARSPLLRAASVHVGSWMGLFAGWLLSGRYQEFLLLLHGGEFGRADPVFHRDIGFYVFTLPAWRTMLVALTGLALVGCVSAVVGRYDQLGSGRAGSGDLSPWRKAGSLSSMSLVGCVVLFGLTQVVRTFLARYGLLVANNEASGVRTGAEFLDLEGFFSTRNFITVSAMVELGLLAVVGFALVQLSRRSGSQVTPRWPGTVAMALLGVELMFFLSLVVRDHVFVSPNEPNIQLPYIQRHMAATLAGYRLADIRTIPWSPPATGHTAQTILSSVTVQNAPILPGWVSHLENPPDIQHFERVEAAASTMVYGPMLQVFEQEQQLRSYYKFLSVDAVRYRVDGQKRMYVSAVRELPSRAFVGPQEWLRYWGSAALMYTHGLGLVMSPANQIDAEGSPLYAVRDIPPRTETPQFAVEPRIYFGESLKDDYVLTDINGLEEFDHATRQFRSEFVYPPEARDGIRVNSVFRRIVFALYTRDLTAFLFSRFIDHDRTRVHIHRTPLRRVSRIAPFLFLDSNPYAFIAEERIEWMVNGLTTTDQYPYAFREVLGDKADERAVEEIQERTVNYVEDAVKVTVDAFGGDVHFYRIADDPIVETWARIYPGLFETGPMPAPVAEQLTYPLQWFHLQFDDIYKRYHQLDPIEFYNVEDLWDDADEVLGSIGRGLTEFGTTDQMTFSYEGYHLLLDPADIPGGGDGGPGTEPQFVMLMPFTPDGARNLRSLIVVFQDPGRYGELLNLRIPQGAYFPGPEQADALIDDDSQVNQQITLWVRHGSEVLRGHTLLLPVRGDILYVEPLWISSLQNELPQIKLFSVVYRGRTTMGTTLREAIELLDLPEELEAKAYELPWFRTERPTEPPPTPDESRRP